MAAEFAASIFGDPNPSMASSSHTSLHHSTMPPFFDSSMYTGPGSHWAAPYDYAPSDDQWKTRPQAPMESDFLLFG
jgi:hypothetical protein